jgi:hypothetical protein
MPEDISKSLRAKIPEKIPDLVMQVKATPEQMKSFGIKIEDSKIIQSCFNTDDIDADMQEMYYGRENVFNFSRNNQSPKLYHSGEIDLVNTRVTFGAESHPINNVYNFPNAIIFSLSYFTPKTKPRTDVPGEYRAGDYFELIITNKDGSKKTFYLEQNLEIFNR